MSGPAPSIWQRVSVICSLVALMIGGLTVLGWITGWEALASVRSKYIPMAPSTALAFTLIGVALITHTSQRRSVRYAAAGGVAVVALLALAKIAEFLWPVSFGLDELLVADPAMFGSVRKGRMSPITAGNFLATSMAALCLLRASWRPWAARIAALLGLVSLVIVLGYLYGTPLLYGGTIIPVALPTAVAFLGVAGSIIAAAGPGYWPLRSWVESSTRTLLVRWFLPLLVGGALIAGFVLIKLLAVPGMNPALVSASTTLVIALIFSGIISEVARMMGGRIDRAERDRAAAQEELRALNSQLEERITIRTAELSLKNQQMQEELAMARELQMAMLPKSFPNLPGSASPSESALRFFSFYFPTGDVSGDFFNVFPISDSQVGIVICDVMGHGVRAALVTSMVRALMEQHSKEISDPGELLTLINSGLVSILKNTGLVLFVTSLVLVADTKKKQFSYANAGHPRPLHVRREVRQTVSLNGPTGPALGLFDTAKYHSSAVDMSSGDLVILFTDGLFEVESPEAALYSQTDLQAAVQKRNGSPPARLFDEVLSDVRQFSRRTDFDDDVCIVGVEVVGKDEIGIGEDAAIRTT